VPPAVWSGPAAISARARTGLTAPAVITGDSSRPVKGFRVVPAADITAPRTRLPGPAGPGRAAGTGPAQGSPADTSTWGAAARWVGWTSGTRLTGPSASARPPPGINA
jgi:hypothetical protein